MIRSWMMRAPFAWLAVWLGLWIPNHAFAQQPDLQRAIASLKDQDFRVRTQAALALGASKDVRARPPLCATLADANTTVRAAAAAALGRLSLGVDGCLEKRLELETNEVVRSAIEKALELVAAPRISEVTEYYIAVAKLSDKSGRSGPELQDVVRSGIQSAAAELETFALAPAWESTSRAKQRLARHPRVKAFYLSPRIPPFQYAADGLTVRIEVAMFTYPEKSLLGNYTVRLTQPDAAEGDLKNENELVKMAAERALAKFAKLAPQL